MISADVDLAAEFEREHKKIKEERARKQREKQAEADERRTQEQGSERLLAKDANQSLNKSKADSSKTTGSAGIKRLGTFIMQCFLYCQCSYILPLLAINFSTFHFRLNPSCCQRTWEQK